MPTSPNTSEQQTPTYWLDRVWASFIYFTRLPLWRLHQPAVGCYRTVVEQWPLVGWLTGAAAGAVIYWGSMVMPMALAIVVAIVLRLLLTGALHEDGLADFFDGFGGGGSDRQRVLDIMKDSHIGTYGVLALVVYVLLLLLSLLYMPPAVAALCIAAADPFGKLLASGLVLTMPYARTAEQAKSKMVYRPIRPMAVVGLLIYGVAPLVFFLCKTGLPWYLVAGVPLLVAVLLIVFVYRRLHGYTGDCCGAVSRLAELAVCLVVTICLYCR